MPRLASVPLSLCLAVLAAAPRASAQSPAEVAQAREEYHAAQSFYDRRDFEHALTLFRLSLAALPSPNTRLYIARCLRETGHLVEAYAAFDQTASEATEREQSDPRYRETRVSAINERNALARSIAFVSLRVAADVPSDTVVQVAGADVPRANWSTPQPVAPGFVLVTANATGVEPFRIAERLDPGASIQVAISFSSPSSAAPTTPRDTASASPDPAPFLAAGAIVLASSAVTFAAALVMGKLDADEYSYLQTICAATCMPARPADVSRGLAYQTAANVLFAASGALLLGGAALLTVGLHRWTHRAPSVAIVPLDSGAMITAGARF